MHLIHSLFAASTDPSDIVCSTPDSTTLVLNWTQATDASVAGYHLDIFRSDGLRVEFGLPVRSSKCHTCFAQLNSVAVIMNTVHFCMFAFTFVLKCHFVCVAYFWVLKSVVCIWVTNSV